MVEPIEPSLLHILLLSFLFATISVIVSWIAWGKGFYKLPHKDHPHPPLAFIHVAASFLLFIAVYIFFAPIILRILGKLFYLRLHHINIISLLQLTVFVITACLLFIYAAFFYRSSFRRIWKDQTFPDAKPLSYDITVGLLTWLISFPVVVTASELSSALTLFIFEEIGKEQLAIQYLKLAIETPFSMCIAFITILIGAPLLEEYLFRGVLQTWLRNKFSCFPAIVFSSLAFATFHLSPSQGLGNITLFVSLFTFALYLGFVYERQRSLFANIFLHMTFNLISVVRILSMEA